MHEQLDKDLTKRIAAVFENYEDPGANEGWLSLREKFPVDKRRGLLWFWLSGAAVLLLFLGIGLWRYNDGSPDKDIVRLKQNDNNHYHIAGKKIIAPSADNRKLITNDKPVTKRNASANGAQLTVRNEAAKNQNKLNKDGSLVLTTALIKKDARLKRPGSVKVSKHSREKMPDENTAQTKRANKVLSSRADADLHALIVQRPDSATDEKNVTSEAKQTLTVVAKPRRVRGGKKTKATNKEVTEGLDDTSQDHITLAVKQPVAEKDAVLVMAYKKPNLSFNLTSSDIKLPVEKPDEAKNSIYTMFAADQHKPQEEAQSKSKKVQFGVYEATYLNYAKGSDDQVNVGVGVSSDIYLTENLKLVTGVSLGRNSFNYGGNSAVSGVQSDNVAVSLAAVYGPAPSSVSNFYGLSFTPATELKSYNAGLVDLDIPVNLKYEFNAKKNNLYISTGFSSGTFVSETYTYQYNYQASSTPFNQQTFGTTTNKSFNNFYFAKTINLAFGAGIPFGKNRLIFEPFLKYPIGGLGSEDIHFGSTGLNLKFKFQ